MATIEQQIPSGPITYDQWASSGETTLPVDIIKGVVIMSPAPSELHQRVVLALALVIAPILPAGFRLGLSPLDWILWEVPLHVRQPDLMVISEEQARDGLIRSAPLVAVEVLSPTSRERDLVTKPAEYGRAGLKHLWLMDPSVPEVVAKRWDGAAWIEVGRATGSAMLSLTDPITVNLVPAFLVK